LQDGRQQVVADGAQQGAGGGRQQHRAYRPQRRAPRHWHRRGLRLAPFAVTQHRIGGHAGREAGVPAHVQPGGALAAAAQQAAGREQAREGQHVHHRHHHGEQVAAGQHQQGTRAQDAEVTEQHHRGNQVVEDQAGFIDRDKRSQRRQRHPGVGQQRDKYQQRDQRDAQCQPARRALHRHRRQ
jgi:hypothetical protein